MQFKKKKLNKKYEQFKGRLSKYSKDLKGNIKKMICSFKIWLQRVYK